MWAWEHYDGSRVQLTKEYFSDETIIARGGWLGALSRSWPQAHAADGEKTISARDMFQAYVDKAQWHCRMSRVAVATVAYMGFGFGFVFIAEGGMPDRLHVRGVTTQQLDLIITLASAISFIALVFYVLDAVRLTARLLHGICGPHTNWPEKLLKKKAAEHRVQAADLAGWLDVRFAAEKSEEAGRLIYLPFIIQFIFILSRNSYFDRWTWPSSLIAIFIGNILLASAAWVILRSAACEIRREATGAMEKSLAEAQRDLDREMEAAADRRAATSQPLEGSGDSFTISEKLLTKLLAAKERLRGLEILQKEIEKEHRGAYARFFQDPALMALLLPTGLFGVLTVLFRTLFGVM